MNGRCGSGSMDALSSSWSGREKSREVPGVWAYGKREITRPCFYSSAGDFGSGTEPVVEVVAILCGRRPRKVHRHGEGSLFRDSPKFGKLRPTSTLITPTTVSQDSPNTRTKVRFPRMASPPL